MTRHRPLRVFLISHQRGCNIRKEYTLKILSTKVTISAASPMPLLAVYKRLARKQEEIKQQAMLDFLKEVRYPMSGVE